MLHASSHLTIDRASLSRRSNVPTANGDTSNSWALIVFPYITQKRFVESYRLPISAGGGGRGGAHLNQGRSVVSACLVLQQLQELLLPQLKARPVVHRGARAERLYMYPGWRAKRHGHDEGHSRSRWGRERGAGGRGTITTLSNTRPMHSRPVFTKVKKTRRSREVEYFIVDNRLCKQAPCDISLSRVPCIRVVYNLQSVPTSILKNPYTTRFN